MARLRKGRANTVRGSAHFLRETVGRVRYGRARGQLTVRADSGFYTHAIVAVCRKMDVRYSITIRQHARLRNIIEAIPETDWTPIPYWMDGPPPGETSRPAGQAVTVRHHPSGTVLLRPVVRFAAALDTTISPRAASPPTAPGWRCR